MSPRYGLPDSNAHRFLAPTVLMYSTLLPRMKASPYLFFSCPLTYSSVCSPGQRCQRLQCMPIDTRNAARTITPRGTRARAPHLLHSDVHVAIKAGKDPSVVDPRVELHDDRTTRHLWCSRRGPDGQGRRRAHPAGEVRARARARAAAALPREPEAGARAHNRVVGVCPRRTPPITAPRARAHACDDGAPVSPGDRPQHDAARRCATAAAAAARAGGSPP